MKKIAEYTKHPRQVKVYRNSEWNEYIVKFYEYWEDFSTMHCGYAHLTNADYHTDDKQDAIDTAKYHINGA